jgi:hypothetical protein
MSERVLGSFRSGASSAIRRLQSTSDRLLGKKRETTPFAETQTSDPTCWRTRQTELIEFYSSYEELVTLLCDAAQYGPVSQSEREYQRLRSLLQAGYLKVRRYVVAFLRYSPEDAQVGISLWGKSADAFEALVAAPSLEELLRTEDGSMVSRVMRTREALTLYGEHLQRLAAQA